MANHSLQGENTIKQNLSNAQNLRQCREYRLRTSGMESEVTKSIDSCAGDNL